MRRVGSDTRGDLCDILGVSSRGMAAVVGSGFGVGWEFGVKWGTTPAVPSCPFLCPPTQDCDWASAVSISRVWGVPAGLLGAAGQDPPPDAERELELRCTRPHCLWLPGGGP